MSQYKQPMTLIVAIAADAEFFSGLAAAADKKSSQPN